MGRSHRTVSSPAPMRRSDIATKRGITVVMQTCIVCHAVFPLRMEPSGHSALSLVEQVCSGCFPQWMQQWEREHGWLNTPGD